VLCVRIACNFVVYPIHVCVFFVNLLLFLVSLSTSG